jgi:hypothetical protein
MIESFNGSKSIIDFMFQIPDPKLYKNHHTY